MVEAIHKHNDVSEIQLEAQHWIWQPTDSAWGKDETENCKLRGLVTGYGLVMTAAGVAVHICVR